MNEGLVEMLEYTRWANARLIEGCRGLSDADLDAPPAGTSDAVGAQFTHLVGGQQTFALRTKGRQHEGELNRRSAWPGFDALIELVAKADDTLVEVARTLQGDETVALPYMGKAPVFPVRFFLMHAVTHAAEHRTEIKVALNIRGIETPNLDAWDFAATKGYGGGQ